MNQLSPKASFLKTPEAKEYVDMAGTNSFHRAIEVALAEMQLTPAKGSDAAANWNRLEGAKDFARIMLDLAEPPAQRRRGAPRENLEPA